MIYLIRFCAPQVILFNDDPLRLIRALRFNIIFDMQFAPDLEYEFYNQEHWIKLTTCVSIERIREELKKCFVFNTPKTLRMLFKIDQINPNILESIFKGDLWLLPSSSSSKK